MNWHPFHFIFAFLAGSFSAYIAKNSGKNPLKWFGIGAALGLFGILPIFFLPTSFKRRPPISSIPRQRIFYIEGPADKFWYYLDPEMGQLGPMSFVALTTAWKSGKINPTTYVWNEDLPDWKPLQELIKAQT